MQALGRPVLQELSVGLLRLSSPTRPNWGPLRLLNMDQAFDRRLRSPPQAGDCIVGKKGVGDGGNKTPGLQPASLTKSSNI